eukprot:TRINITY_DN5950_c2_g4_i3.p1 TRINITY_DN5950_c2_g4~~TRINITY_DN5950_c2_g4_i3.p1  ORF type:complete len:490 (-),score=71.91 TRINITY_DN5950_c2_g4_i3:131-1600(-)
MHSSQWLLLDFFCFALLQSQVCIGFQGLSRQLQQQRLSNAHLWQLWVEEMQFKPSKCQEGPDIRDCKEAKTKLWAEVQQNAGECEKLQEFLRKENINNFTHYFGHDLTPQIVEDILKGFFPKSQSKPAPVWRWMCLWSLLLSETVQQHTDANGQWLPVTEMSAQEILAEGGLLPGDNKHQPTWPILIKGGAQTLLKEPEQHVWKSTEKLAKLLPKKIELNGCFKNERHSRWMSVKDWVSNPKFSLMKSNNIKLWGEEDDDSALIRKKVAETVLNVGNYSRLLGHKPNELTMNWAPFPHCRHLPMHHDGKVQVACQVSGDKTWTLLPGESLASLVYPQHLIADQKEPARVDFDPFNPKHSLACFPDIKETMPPPLSVRVKEGDCILLPAFMLHATYGHGDSISINSEVGGSRVSKQFKKENLLLHAIIYKAFTEVYKGETAREENDEDEEMARDEEDEKARLQHVEENRSKSKRLSNSTDTSAEEDVLEL